MRADLAGLLPQLGSPRVPTVETNLWAGVPGRLTSCPRILAVEAKQGQCSRRGMTTTPRHFTLALALSLILTHPLALARTLT